MVWFVFVALLHVFVLCFDGITSFWAYHSIFDIFVQLTSSSSESSDAWEPFPSVILPEFQIVHLWPGTARRANHYCAVSWKSTGCIIKQIEKEEASGECPIWHTVGNPCGELDYFLLKTKVRAGVYCRHTFEPSLFSPIGHGPLVFVGCVCWEVWFLVALFLSMIFQSHSFV